MDNLKNLRELSGAGILDCKKALDLNNNNIQQSIDFLRKKGLAKASKKSSRITNEGAVGIFENPNKTILIEINTETDFAAKNDTFLNFVDKIASYALEIDDEKEININNFSNKKFENKKISELFNDIIAKVGENIVLKRLYLLSIKNSNEKIFTYTHNSYRKNIGKICVALKTEIDSVNEDSSKLGKNLCMQIAALKPLSLDINTLDDKIIENEKEIQSESIKSSGKDDSIINKILEGKMKKFYSEVTLMNQQYIFNEEKTVKNIIEEFNSNNGSFKIINFSLFVLGS